MLSPGNEGRQDGCYIVARHAREGVDVGRVTSRRLGARSVTLSRNGMVAVAQLVGPGLWPDGSRFDFVRHPPERTAGSTLDRAAVFEAAVCGGSSTPGSSGVQTASLQSLFRTSKTSRHGGVSCARVRPLPVRRHLRRAHGRSQDDRRRRSDRPNRRASRSLPDMRQPGLQGEHARRDREAHGGTALTTAPVADGQPQEMRATG
jgi:hypothetical protein